MPRNVVESFRGSLDPALASEEFIDYLESIDVEKLKTREGRIELTREDPLLFALLYLPKLLCRGPNGKKVITFGAMHFELCEYAKAWIQEAQLRESRTAFVAPRGAGKSTWLFVILPLWAAAHEHIKFIAAIGSTRNTVLKLANTFRAQLQMNELLRHDFPEFCEPMLVPDSDPENKGRPVSNAKDRFIQSNGFVMNCVGRGSGIRGMNELGDRPDLIIIDDLEQGAAKYTDGLIENNIETLRGDILQLNEEAHVVLVGTVVRMGSIVHQLVQSELASSENDPDWIEQENFKVKYFPPLIDTEDGRVSMWPGKWPAEYFLSRLNDRMSLKEHWNQPINAEGNFWTEENITIARTGAEFSGQRKLIVIDPATTSKLTSDFTGIAVVGCDVFQKRYIVEGCWQKKFRQPVDMRTFVLALIEEFDDVMGVLIETNQGGDVWEAILHDLPVKLYKQHSMETKVQRLESLFIRYTRSEVFHRKRFPELEAQMFAYDGKDRKGSHDDMIDAVGLGVEHFHRALNEPRRVRHVAKKVKYA